MKTPGTMDRCSIYDIPLCPDCEKNDCHISRANAQETDIQRDSGSRTKRHIRLPVNATLMKVCYGREENGAD
jgi:hypothetical protein